MTEEERLRRAADDVSSFCAGIEQQLREQGLRGIPDLVESYERIRKAVVGIRPHDLERALVDVGLLLDRLRLISSRLEALGEMKRILLGAERGQV